MVVDRSYRALRVVAVLAPLVGLTMQVLFGAALASGMFYHFNGMSFFAGQLAYYLWTDTMSLSVPVVSIMSITFAAQQRRWGWMWLFVVCGLIGIYVPGIIMSLGPALDSFNRHLMLLIESTYVLLLPQLLSPIAALVFTARAPRTHVIEDDGLERTSLA